MTQDNLLRFNMDPDADGHFHPGLPPFHERPLDDVIASQDAPTGEPPQLAQFRFPAPLAIFNVIQSVAARHTDTGQKEPVRSFKVIGIRKRMVFKHGLWILRNRPQVDEILHHTPEYDDLDYDQISQFSAVRPLGYRVVSRALRLPVAGKPRPSVRLEVDDLEDLEGLASILETSPKVLLMVGAAMSLLTYEQRTSPKLTEGLQAEVDAFDAWLDGYTKQVTSS